MFSKQKKIPFIVTTILLLSLSLISCRRTAYADDLKCAELSEAVNRKKAAVPGIDVSCECELIERLSTLLSKTFNAYAALEKAEKIAVGKKDEDASFYYRNTVEAKMVSLRKSVDEMETLTSRDAWPMPTYGDMTFGV